MKLSDIRGLWILRRKYSVDTLTDTATVDFGCANLSSQSKKKKKSIIEVSVLVFLDKLFLLI